MLLTELYGLRPWRKRNNRERANHLFIYHRKMEREQVPKSLHVVLSSDGEIFNTSCHNPHPAIWQFGFSLRSIVVRF